MPLAAVPLVLPCAMLPPAASNATAVAAFDVPTAGLRAGTRRGTGAIRRVVAAQPEPVVVVDDDVCALSGADVALLAVVVVAVVDDVSFSASKGVGTYLKAVVVAVVVVTVSSVRVGGGKSS